MAEWTLPLTAEGAVTAPTGAFTWAAPLSQTQVFLDIGPVNLLEIADFGWALADGVNPLRLVTRGAVFDAGGLAPNVSMTLAVTGGVRATVVGTYTGQPANNETITLGRPGFQVVITWKNALVTDGTVGDQVLIGGDADTSYANLVKLINGTGTQGVEFFNLQTFLGKPDDYQDIYFLEVSAHDTGGNTVTVRYVQYGTLGNTAVSTETTSNFTFASATLTGGVDGTGTELSVGTYRYFFTWFRSSDGAETGRSPIVSITKNTNARIDITGLTDSADTTFDFIRIYRTTATGTEFRLVGTNAAGDSTFTDDVSDVVLAESIEWTEALHRAYSEGKPPRGRALALWKGRLWSLGAHLHAEYSRGTVAVTEGSATVTFSVKGVTTRMVGRTFRAASTSEDYTVLSVNESGPTAVLDRVYEGVTNGTASFTIRDDYDACAIRASVQFLYNQWPTTESPGRVDTDDVAGGTALLATRQRLFAFSKTSIASVTGEDPDSWEVTRVSADVGCESPGLLCPVEGGGVFLSKKGIYAIAPDETLTPLSSPASPRRVNPRGIDGTMDRIAWAHTDQGYSTYDPIERVVVFGVPLDGATVPNYEIVLDLQNSEWALYKRAEWTTSAVITLPDGGQALLAGDREGHIWHVNIGESDGFYGTEAVQTLTGAQTVRTLTVTGTPFSTSGTGEKGKPVLILYADGTTLAYGKVASNTTSALTLAEDLATAPAASDQIILGGIAWQAKSGFFTGPDEFRAKALKSVTIRHSPTTRGQYHLSFAVDGGSYIVTPVGTSLGSLSQANGKTRHFTQYPGDSHSINLRGFKPGGRARIRGGVLEWILREDGRM